MYSTPSLALASRYAPATPISHRVLVLGVMAAHLAALWGLMQVSAVRSAVHQVAPLVVSLITLPKPVEVPAPRVAPPPKSVPLPVIPLPAIDISRPTGPTITVAATDTPPPPQPRIEPPPAAASPPQPLTIPASAVGYVELPAVVYPAASKRLGEKGRVMLRVEIGVQGRALQVQVSRSSGWPRLDEAALTAVRAARFKPYLENGEPRVVWAVVPIDFDIEG